MANQNNKMKEHIKKGAKELQKEVVEHIVTLITTALMLVAGLAWNEAIKSLFEMFFAGRDTLVMKFLYAFVVTIIVVLLVWWIGRIIRSALTAGVKDNSNES